ncbi:MULTISPECIES: porin [Burkholderiaceae]|uniref:porin n=1 Tax=Burkholderiaceae TaxID=119060 RepID=UPI00141D9600|nr:MULTISPECIES: porin [Burkholderiaceae]NIF51012.1 porin [Burkholderia sp. Ax-1724]NIF75847.1 porin [Paraburkholderia sp. Cy-641]
MKKIVLSALIAGLSPCLSHAQSSVTLYGDIGAGVRWVNNQKGGSAVMFNNNILAVNRFGLYGKEDLGNGLSAIFKLENAFNSGTGALKNAGVLFSQAAFVGLSNDFGRLTFGRQVSASEYFATLVDPTGGQAQSLAIQPNALYFFNYFTDDTRFNNTISYIGHAGGFHFGGSYSPGGVAGNLRSGTNVSGTAMYQWGPALAGFGYQKTWSATATQWAQTFHTGGSLQLGPARLYMSYADFSVSAATEGQPTRRDHIPSIGVMVVATPELQFTAAAYYDSARHLANAQDGSGHKVTTFAIAEYYLSKRTELYAEADYNGFSGAYRTDALNIAGLGMRSGASSTTGVTLGLMTRF